MINCKVFEGSGRGQVLFRYLPAETEENQEKHRSAERVQSYHLRNANLGRYRYDNPFCLDVVGDGEVTEPCRIPTSDLIPGSK
jgi:hypothetical protein